MHDPGCVLLSAACQGLDACRHSEITALSRPSHSFHQTSHQREGVPSASCVPGTGLGTEFSEVSKTAPYVPGGGRR